MPHLPRNTQVDVTKCHPCYAKPRWMSPSATPATQKPRWISPSATPATQSGMAPRATQRAQPRHQSQPSVPSATWVDVTKCHACHASGCGRLSAPKRATRANPVPQVPRLPRETKVDVTKWHACHAKWCGAPGDPACPSAPEPTQCRKCHACHTKCKSTSPSATPATHSTAERCL